MDATDLLSLKHRGKPARPICHMFWSGKELPLFRYLAAVSASQVWGSELYLWTDNPPSGDRLWKQLVGKDSVTLCYASDLLPDWQLASHGRFFRRIRRVMDGYHPTAQTAQIKDILVWRALREYGGVFLDADVLAVRPFWNEFQDVDEGLMVPGFPATGVLAADVGAEAVEWLVDWTERVLCPDTIDDLPLEGANPWNLWTFFGPTALLHLKAQHNLTDVWHAPQEWFYWGCDALDSFFEESGTPVPEFVRMLHIYGEGRNEMDSSIDPDQEVTTEFLRTSSSPYARAVRQVAGPGDVLLQPPPPASAQIAPGKSVVMTEGETVETAASPSPESSFVLTVMMKDEKENLRPALESVLPVFDRWILLDTGSSDGTLAAARAFFAEHGISRIPDDTPLAAGYRIYERKWKGFLRSRNESLELAGLHAGPEDYIGKLDMDERLVGAERLVEIVREHSPSIISVLCYQVQTEREERFAFPRMWHVSTDPHYIQSDHEVLDFRGQSGPAHLAKPRRGEANECWVKHLGGARSPGAVMLTLSKLCRDIDEAARKGQIAQRPMFYYGRDVRHVSTAQSEYWLRQAATCPRTGPSGTEHAFFARLYLGDALQSQGKLQEAIEEWWSAAYMCDKALQSREPLDRIGSFSRKEALRLEQAGSPEKALYWWAQSEAAYAKALPRDVEPAMMMLFVEGALYTEAAQQRIQEHLQEARSRLLGRRPDSTSSLQEQISEWYQNQNQKAGV